MPDDGLLSRVLGTSALRDADDASKIAAVANADLPVDSTAYALAVRIVGLLATLGEVQSSPTANTLLDRLKQIHTDIATTLIGKLPAVLGDGGGLKVESSGRTTATATIASSASLSGAVDLGENYMAARLTMPAAWTAASLSFQVSADGMTFNEMRDDNSELVGRAVDAGYDIALLPALWRGVRYLKIRSGTLANAIVQAGSRDIVIIKAPIAAA